jgi:hypothetical protein
LLLPCLLFGAGLLARATTSRAWSAFTGYETPFAIPAEDPGTPPPPLAERVAILLVDGLSYRGSLGMPFLNVLRGRGADFVCQVGVPSLSMPGRAVLLTGAWQEVHGQTTNFNVRPLRVDTLYAAARRKGVKTGLVGGAATLKLLSPAPDWVKVLSESGPSRDFGRFVVDLHRASEATREALRDHPDLGFVFAELDVTDEAGHEWGGASPQYAQAAAEADEAIRSLSSSLDLTKDVLLVTADHGHTSAGGHGGAEKDVMEVPLVLVGRGIRPSVKGSAEQIDVAPTVAALLGTPIPASNEGKTLLEALAVTPENEAALLASLCLVRRSFVSHYVAFVEPGASLTGTTCAGDAASLRESLRFLDALQRDVKKGRERREQKERGRVTVGSFCAAALILLGLLMTGLVDRGIGRRAFVLGLLGAGLYYLLLPVVGLSYSFSAVNKDENLGFFFGKDMALAFGVVALTVLVASRGGERRSLLEAARGAWIAEAAFLVVLLAKIAIVYWRFGVFLSWALPDSYWSFGFYLDALAVMAVGLGTPVLPLFAWLGRLGRGALSSRVEEAP